MRELTLQETEQVAGGDFATGVAALGGAGYLVSAVGATTAVAAAPLLVTGAIIIMAGYGSYQVGRYMFGSGW